jgi:hypothetical protein
LPRFLLRASAERLSNIPEPVCDLVETRSAQHLISRRKLWSWVFAAILDEDLRPEGMSLKTDFSHGAIAKPLNLGQLIKHELRGWEQHNHDPSRWSWMENIKFSPVHFDRWLKGAERAHRFPTRPKRRAGAKKTTGGLLKEFIDATYPDGPPASLSYKEIAGQAKPIVGKVVCPRTVARALGRK